VSLSIEYSLLSKLNDRRPLKNGKEAGGAAILYSLPYFNMFDPMSELGGSTSQSDDEGAADGNAAARGRSSGNGAFAQEVHSVTIHARQRTFYVDLKESSHGKFFKVSEKSRGGQKTTIMFDAEDLDKFIEAFQEMKSKI